LYSKLAYEGPGGCGVGEERLQGYRNRAPLHKNAGTQPRLSGTAVGIGNEAIVQRHAIFLSGPIGAGKTALGRGLADKLDGAFVDGDDFADHTKPWYGSILHASEAIVRDGLAALRSKPAVVVAYPLRCTNWIYFKRRFGDEGALPIFVSLRASFESIVHSSRGRTFSDRERVRIREMIAEGYGSRAFSDLVVDTGQKSFDETAAELVAKVRALM
jgi:hypothetical protein